MPIQPEQTAPAAGRPAAFTTAAAGEMKLPRNQDAWTWMVSPVMLGCMDGAIVPLLAKAWHTPGTMGNGRGVGTGQGAQASMAAQGFIPIPHDVPATAFGVARNPGNGSTYIDRYESRGVVYHCDAWHRPQQIGHMTRWEWDRDGWRDWLVSLRDRFFGDLADFQIEIATRPLLDEIDALSHRDDNMAPKLIAERLRQLPPEFHPPGMMPDPPTKGTSRKRTG